MIDKFINMQITETGLAAATNVENSESSAHCNAPIAQPPLPISGATNCATLITPDAPNSTLHKPKMSESGQDDILVDTNCQNIDETAPENENNCPDNNNGVIYNLDQADTSSVENLSIVTVVEKELEGNTEIIDTTSKMENINGEGTYTLSQ